jgi:hypothetical protein
MPGGELLAILRCPAFIRAAKLSPKQQPAATAKTRSKLSEPEHQRTV